MSLLIGSDPVVAELTQVLRNNEVSMIAMCRTNEEIDKEVLYNRALSVQKYWQKKNAAIAAVVDKGIVP